MGNILKLITPIPVSVNHYLKPRAFLIHGKPQISMYETAEAKAYKKYFSQYVKDEISKQDYTLTPNKHQHFYIDCVFYFNRIDMDANNYFKILLDAITDTQLIWLDDNVTCERVQAIYYDNKNPRIEITIYPVDYIGIFDNNERLIDFEFRCCTCKRWNNKRCSIYKKALEGRIQNEINDFICTKYKKKKES